MNRSEHGKARQGHLTGSMAKRLMGGSYRTWNTLLDEIRNPRPFHDVGPNTPAPLAWGTQHERQAAGQFWERHPELELHHPVYLSYYADHPLRQKWLGVSPDRMLTPADKSPDYGFGYTEGLEIKCPYLQEKHYDWAQANVVPKEHKDQCYWGILVTGVANWRFVSFDPRNMDYFETNLIVDPSYLVEMEDKADRFLEVLDSGEIFKPIRSTPKALQEMFNV